ncbi:CDP-alcohol phosphatidyltransferase family protein [Dictyobacter aurantiacus]|uniref:CDP-diacylglycerol--inositol 3-phosphatidyltransferase n=1 Tax=Dictyobacter aurantiacus TaxID=1936993 RepID=A0A401ZNK1_9CHLR|nr:CDP-alcohol phosphatidyltransferase family protein [Dictyobacter aurantiacus]GCE08439.1 CDP-diacylglycerol--inositol 3-phosphatidyltransferase [Dictyobacter aurantiacus]
MFNKDIQKWARQLAAQIIRPLANLGITPNTLTLIGLFFSVVTAAVISQGLFLIGGLLVLFTGIFDLFDGATARLRNIETTFGAFLDSTLDRYSEAIILGGLLFYALFHPTMQANLWFTGSAQVWMIALIYISIVGSLMVSYTKARAEGLDIECKTGLLARPERVVVLAAGLLFGLTMWALLLLAVFSNITAVERMFAVYRATQHANKQHAEASNPGRQSPISIDHPQSSAREESF